MKWQSPRWLTRLKALNSGAEDFTVPGVSHVQLVSDRQFDGSREAAPFARHSAFLAAAGAGVHNFVEVVGTGQESLRFLLHQARLETQMANLLTGFFSWAVVNGAGLTTATRVATTPTFRDVDPQITPQLFVGTITTANLPASRTILPRANAIGQTNASPSFPTCVTDVKPLRGLPFAAEWNGPLSLIFYQETANEIVAYDVAWQAIRA